MAASEIVSFNGENSASWVAFSDVMNFHQVSLQILFFVRHKRAAERKIHELIS